MIAVSCILAIGWLVTMAAWQIREKEHAKERMETLKLFRAQSLSDYTSSAAKSAGTQNFVQAAMQRAYAERLGDADDY